MNEGGVVMSEIRSILSCILTYNGCHGDVYNNQFFYSGLLNLHYHTCTCSKLCAICFKQHFQLNIYFVLILHNKLLCYFKLKLEDFFVLILNSRFLYYYF